MLLQAGRALDAREHFEIIVRARPTYLDAAAMLGLACYLAGDGLGAKQVWEACRDRRPEERRGGAYLPALARNDTGAAAAGAGGPAPPTGPPHQPTPPAAPRRAGQTQQPGGDCG